MVRAYRAKRQLRERVVHVYVWDRAVRGQVLGYLGDFKNVNQTNPIDQAGGSVNTTALAAVAFPKLTSAYPNELAVYSMFANPGGTYPNSCMNFPFSVNSRSAGCAGGGYFSYNFGDANVPASGTIISGTGSALLPKGTLYNTSAASTTTAFTIRGVNN